MQKTTKPEAAAMALSDLFDRYRSRKLIDAAPCTIRKYERMIRVATEVLGRTPMVADLNDDLVCAVMRAIVEKGRTTYTANDGRAKLVALWTWAAKKNLVAEFPDVDSLREPEHAPVAWLRDELRHVFAACDRAKWSIHGIPGPVWYRALLLVLWDTGERIGALLKTPFSRLSGTTLVVPASVRKGKTRDKVYTLDTATVESLLEMRRYHSGDMLFPRDCSAETVANRWRACLRRAGLPHDRKHMFHCIRRSVASHAKAAGADSTALLDHSDGAITRRFYLDPRVAKPVSAVDVLFRPSDIPEEGGPGHAE
jgi:integrase